MSLIGTEKEFNKAEIAEAANRHTEIHGAKARINKEEFFEELGIEGESLVDALERIENSDTE